MHLYGKPLFHHLVRKNFWKDGIIFIDNDKRVEKDFAHLKFMALKAAGFTIKKRKYM